MSRHLYAEIKCTPADKDRLRAAVDLIEALNKGGEPDGLPAPLVGRFKSVVEFNQEIVHRGCLYYVDYHEEPGRVIFDDGELDLNGMIDLIQACFVDSLPAMVFWTEDHAGGVSVIFEKGTRDATTWEVADQLIEEGPRKPSRTM